LKRTKNTKKARSAPARTPKPHRGAPKRGGGQLRVGEGIVSAHRNGFGFVRVEGLEDGVFLPPREMEGLVHGDRVRISLEQDRQGRWAGRVQEVLGRGIESVLGIMETRGREFAVRAADRRLNLLCLVRESGGAKAGDWVIARITEYPKGDEPGLARVTTILDPDRPVQMATETAIARFGLAVEFPAPALREAESWGHEVDPKESARRTDLRSLPLVTIDGEDARDFDDAVYAERQGSEFRLVVAIADVSHYVQPGSALDNEARARGTSVYFPTRVLPMLPAALSNHLCSLEPHVDRLCMVADMTITERGELKDVRTYPAVMRSAARLTYDQANAILFERHSEARAALGDLVARLEPLVEVYQALGRARGRRGALDFDAPEAEFVFRGEQVSDIAFVSRNHAHKLIEECMVLANVAVAKCLQSAKVPTLYRVHGVPEQRKLDLLRTTLKILNIDLQLPAKVQTRDLSQISKKIRDPELRPFAESLVVRSLAQALYQPENIGHFGLALSDYAHFTSPIRRYPDLMVHRSLRAMIGNIALTAIPDEEALLPMGADLSRLEKRADEADRYVSSFLKCVFLRDRVGQTFEALVTTVVEFGCFVQLLTVGVDGLLHLTALTDDDYELARDGGQWIGKRTHRRLAPGTTLRVTVTNVRPVEGMVDLELAST
jgi:ribonuclease R